MKVNTVTNKVNFGYNKKYHDKVHEYLSTRTKYKELAQTLMQTDDDLLKMEDKLCEMEKTKKGVQSQQFFDMASCFVDLKQALAYHIANAFPSLKYPDNIYNDYQAEISDAKLPEQKMWRRNLCEQIGAYMQTPVPAISNTKKQVLPDEKRAGKKDIIEKTLEEVRQQAVDDYQKDMANDLLSKYTVTHLSPQGFDDVVGMEDIKQRFREEIIDYASNPLLAELDEYEYGISAPRGFLFYGPPGCGKTYIVQALAAESGLPLYKMDVSKIGSKWVNQTGNNIQRAFDFLEKTVQINQKPCILFMDEIDSLAISREGASSGGSSENLKTTATLLKLIESAREKGIIVIAATNRYDIIDNAIQERFDSQIYFGLSNIQQIEALVKTNLSRRKKGENLASDEKAVGEISKKLLGYSNRSIVFILDNAAKIAKRKLRRDISKQDVLEAIEKSEAKKIDESQYKKLSERKRSLGFSN